MKGHANTNSKERLPALRWRAVRRDGPQEFPPAASQDSACQTGKYVEFMNIIHLPIEKSRYEALSSPYEKCFQRRLRGAPSIKQA